MKLFNFKYFEKKYKLKNDNKNESELQRVYNYSIYSRGSKIYLDKGFVNIDNGSQGASHWTCFIIKDNKSFYLASFGGQPDKFFLNQLPKPIEYHLYKIQDKNLEICGCYCLHFFYLFERMNYYDATLKMYFQLY